MDPVWECIQKAQAGDTEASGQLLEENQGLVWSIVRRYAGRGQDLEDLFQIGSMGLLKAIWKFDFSYGTRLSTYAVPMIIGEIRRFLRDDGLIKVSRTIQGHAQLLRRAEEQLTFTLGRTPTITELAEASELTMEETMLAYGSLEMIESLEQPALQNNGDKPAAEATLKMQIADTALIDEKEEIMNHMLLEDLMSRLSREEQHLIHMRYIDEQTQTAIANRLGISQVQVCRMEKKILKKMREMALAGNGSE